MSDTAAPTPPIKMGWGWKRSRPDYRDHKATPRLSVVENLPKAVDLRSTIPFPPWDQGRIGSCTAHAWGALFAHARKRAGRRMWVPSRQFVYWVERSEEGTVAVDAGAEMRTGALVLRKYGAPPESYWKYVDTPSAPDGTWKPSDQPRRKPTTQSFTVAEGYQGVTFAAVDQTLPSLKGMLAEGWPVCFGFMVFSSLYDWSGNPKAVLPLPARTDRLLGGHAVTLVGYNDSGDRMDLGGGHSLPSGCFLVRNSWGDAQMAGHFGFPFEYALNQALSSDYFVLTSTEK